MDQHIEHILNQIPGWNAAGARVAPLIGGITNQNYRVDIGGETFVLRIGGKGTHLLGIDRGRESICTAIAAQVGVGAEVIHFLPAEDVLITRFIDGTAITPETAAQHEYVASYRRFNETLSCRASLPRHLFSIRNSAKLSYTGTRTQRCLS